MTPRIQAPPTVGGGATAPLVSTAESTAAPAPRIQPGEVPVQLTSFVGREFEVAALRAVLGEGRLVTLTGAGGSGKTRLALEVAGAAAGDHADGIRWVELAPLSRADLLPQHVAAALDLAEAAARPWREVLLEELRHASMLLVLDNCEHLVDACAELVELVLKGCPRLRILTTSREALGVSGERAWLVPGLSLPANGGPAEASEAVQLFVQRARAAVPSFALTEDNAEAVVRICHRLDGLPLAIELAAARVRVLAPEQIAERLDVSFSLLAAGGRGAPPRHRTLRETLDWSFALLGEAERRLLRRLSVFAGSFALDAVERVCVEDGEGEEEVLDLLTALVDKSLVLVHAEGEEARYRLLETVRQYAAEHLAEAGETERFGRRHADHFLALAEALAPEIFGGFCDPALLDRLDVETPNLRAAGDHFERDGAGPDEELRLYAALAWYWFARARLREGRRRIGNAVGGGGRASPLYRARALSSLASFAFWQGDYGSVRAPAEESVGLLRDLEDDASLSFALAHLGAALLLEGEVEKARGVFEESTALARRTSDDRRLAFSLYWQGRGAKRAGDLEAARAMLHEAVSIGRRRGWVPAVAHPGTVLARVEYFSGDHAAALAVYREVLAALRAIGSGWGLLQGLPTLASVVARVGRFREAARLRGATEALRRTIGSDLPEEEREEHEAELRRLGAALGEVELGRALEEGIALDFGGTLDLAEAEVAKLAERTAKEAEPPPEPVAPAAAPAPPREVAPPAVPGPAAAAAVSERHRGPVPALRVLALGPLEVWRSGERIPHEAWSYARPRELLVYLLCHPDGRTRDQIGLAFWPDGSAAQLKNSFHVTLHHLRRTLGGAEWIVFAGDRYRLNPEMSWDFDAVSFEEGLRSHLGRGRGGSDAERAEGLESALSLYRGDFLEGEVPAPWQAEHRDRWGRLYVEGLMTLGDLRMAEGDLGRASEAFRRVVLRDDLHEEAYRRLMTCLARSGERAEAARQYARLTEALADVLDSSPEPETARLMERIRKAEPV